MQKSYQANAQATLCSWTQTHIVDDQGERANVQHRVLSKCGWTIKLQLCVSRPEIGLQILSSAMGLASDPGC